MQSRATPKGVALDQKNVRRRPTLPQPLGCSTIGAERLNFRVRDGTGCFPFAMAAVTLVVHHPRLFLGGGVQALCCCAAVPYRCRPLVGLLVGNWIVDARHAVVGHR